MYVRRTRKYKRHENEIYTEDNRQNKRRKNEMCSEEKIRKKRYLRGTRMYKSVKMTFLRKRKDKTNEMSVEQAGIKEMKMKFEQKRKEREKKRKFSRTNLVKKD